MTNINKFNKPNTVAQQIAQHIAERIINGEFKNGDQLKVLEVASDYSASQTSVREAFYILERLFLVRNIPRRGAFIRSISIEEIYDVWEIKKRLWSYALRIFCKNHYKDNKTLSEFSYIIDRLISASNNNQPNEAFAYNFELADFIIAKCGNEQLSFMLDSIEMQVKKFRMYSIRLENNLSETARLMELIKDAIKDNKLDLVEKYGAEFIEMDRRILLNNVEKLGSD